VGGKAAAELRDMRGELERCELGIPRGTSVTPSIGEPRTTRALQVAPSTMATDFIRKSTGLVMRARAQYTLQAPGRVQVPKNETLSPSPYP